ncbi:MAG: aconitase X [Nitrososphaerales archaeon]
MHLTSEEEKALGGENGQALATAYRILLAIGEATEAEKLVPVRWAHVSGVNYNTIGDSGVQFLEEMSRDGRIEVRSTINPMGFDPLKISSKLSQEFVEKQKRIVAAYERMGFKGSFTCIPYEVFDLPTKGTDVSFAESNAAVYANSVAGLRTNKESALSALASSLTGKAPYSELRMEEFRKPKRCVKPNFELDDELDYGLLGYFAGKVSDTSIAFSRINSLSRRNAKALSAAIGTSGSCGMFTLGDAPEWIEYGKAEAKKVKDELHTSETGDVITLGSPQLGVKDLSLLADMLEGKKLRKRCLVFCPRAAYESARKLGHAERIERAGAEILCDCCTCLTPMIDRSEVDAVITNSIKGAYYLKSWNKVGVCLKSLKDIVREECE